MAALREKKRAQEDMAEMTMVADSTASTMQRASLVSGGAKKQFAVAIILISVMPVLALAVVVVNSVVVMEDVGVVPRVVLGIALLLVCLGYALLLKSPRTILRLRRYLKQIMDGEAPDAAALIAAENDIDAIAKYLKAIVQSARDQVATIQNQHEELVQAEQQRVMLESLGAACHHLGQPATVICSYLQMLKREQLSESTQNRLDHCLESAKAIEGILRRLQQANEYRTEPYCQVAGEDAQQILKI